MDGWDHEDQSAADDDLPYQGGRKDQVQQKLGQHRVMYISISCSSEPAGGLHAFLELTMTARSVAETPLIVGRAKVVVEAVPKVQMVNRYQCRYHQK
jgi:hypothetical protein